MTPLRTSIAATAVSLLLLLVVFELIRSRRLRERYALLWLLTGVVMLALSLWRSGPNTIAHWFGVTTSPPAVFFAVTILMPGVVSGCSQSSALCWPPAKAAIGSTGVSR